MLIKNVLFFSRTAGVSYPWQLTGEDLCNSRVALTYITSITKPRGKGLPNKIDIGDRGTFKGLKCEVRSPLGC